MRMLGRLLMLVLSLLLIGALWYAADTLLSSLSKRDVQPWEANYEQSTVYILRPGETFDFDVPNDATQLRILHTPAGLPETDEEAELRFTARPADKLSESYNVILRSEKSPTREQLPARFFDAPDDTLAGVTQLHVVSFADRQNLNQFSLTLTESPRPLAIQVAVLQEFSESSLTRMWQRLNDEQKARFFEDHIYPVELVPDQERIARLMERWQPIGPAAVSDGRIVSRTLFVNEQAEPFDNEDVVIDELAVIGPQRWFTVDTRLQPELAAFSCASLTAVSSLAIELSRVTDQGERKAIPIQIDDSSTRVTLPTPPDLYRLSAEQLCELTFYNAQGDVFSADYQYVRASIAQTEAPLTFALVPEAQQVQPLRLDARLVTKTGAPEQTTAALQWSIYNSAGERLLNGQLKPALKVNPYQVSVDSSLSSSVYEKSSQYIVAPAGAAELQVHLASDSPNQAEQILVNLYTRPIDLPYQVEPSDENEPQQQNIPKWFLSYPVPRRANNTNSPPLTTKLLSWQTPLAEVAAAVEVSEEEQWYALSSLHNAPYFELFLPEGEVGQKLSVTDASASLVYYPIAADGSTYVVSSPDHEQRVRPQLVYQKDSAAPVPITVEINGKTVAQDWLNAKSGKLFLPTLAQDDYTLDITAPSAVKWFSNYQSASAQPHYRVRNGYKLTKTLTFELEKTADEEWVTFNYFPAIATPHQLTLILEKQDQVGVYADYTVSKRRFSLATPEGAPSTVLLNQNQPPLWQPKRLPFLLGQDLEAGRYRITVTSSALNSGYIQAGYSAKAPLYQVEIYTEDGNALF